MDERCFKLFLLTTVLCAGSGCAQSRFRAGDLPRKYAAQPIRDYATVDLTPYAQAESSADVIESGDQLQVNLNTGTLQEDSDLTWKVSVDQGGATSLPNIGPVQLAGLTKSEAEKTIVRTSLERDVFLTPTVEVSVGSRVERRIVVSGAVQNPGAIVVRGDSTSLADVIVRSGGLTSDASGVVSVTRSDGRNIALPNEIRSVGHSNAGGVEAITVSLESTSPERIAQIPVPDGAVVHVEETPPRPIQVVGVIRDSAVEVPSGRNIRLLDALTLAGGQQYSNWISDKVTIIRRVPERNETIRIRASIRRAKDSDSENLLLAPYDIVSVEENIVTFTLSTLSGLFGAGASAAQIGAL